MELGGLCRTSSQYEQRCWRFSRMRGSAEPGFVTGGGALPRPGYFILRLTDCRRHRGRHATRGRGGSLFGPVLPVLTFKTIEEVVRRANASRYGLGASSVLWRAAM